MYLLLFFLLLIPLGLWIALVEDKRKRHPSPRELGMSLPPSLKPNKSFFGDGGQPLPKGWQHTRQL